MKVEPAPTCTVHWLPESHRTLADAPAVTVQVDWLEQVRFALSPDVIVQLLCELHCELHDAPHAPLHDAPDVQLNVQPLVVDVQAPLPPKSQAPAAEHEHFVPVQDAGTAVGPESFDEQPAARETTTARARRVVRITSALCTTRPWSHSGTTELQTWHALVDPMARSAPLTSRQAPRAALRWAPHGPRAERSWRAAHRERAPARAAAR